MLLEDAEAIRRDTGDLDLVAKVVAPANPRCEARHADYMAVQAFSEYERQMRKLFPLVSRSDGSPGPPWLALAGRSPVRRNDLGFRWPTSDDGHHVGSTAMDSFQLGCLVKMSGSLITLAESAAEKPVGRPDRPGRHVGRQHGWRDGHRAKVVPVPGQLAAQPGGYRYRDHATRAVIRS